MTSSAESRLAPPVVLITGASSGIGLALACVLASHRVPLILTARRAEALARVGERLSQDGSVVRAHVAHVADASLMERAFDDASELGALAGVVNNAGVLHPVAPVAKLDPAELEDHLRTNVVGVMVGIKLALAHRRAEQPLRVVNVSSGAASMAYQGWAAYCASKAAVNMLTKVASLESTGPNTSIVAVAPGIIETAMQRAVRSADKTAFPAVDQFVELKRSGRLLDPIDASLTLAWLVLDAPMSLSGRFVDARSEEIQGQVQRWLGARRGGEGAIERARAWFGELELGGAGAQRGRGREKGNAEARRRGGAEGEGERERKRGGAEARGRRGVESVWLGVFGGAEEGRPEDSVG